MKKQTKLACAVCSSSLLSLAMLYGGALLLARYEASWWCAPTVFIMSLVFMLAGVMSVILFLCWANVILEP